MSPPLTQPTKSPLCRTKFIERENMAERRLWGIIGLLVFSLILLKIALILPYAYGPTIFPDEILYKRFAQKLIEFGHYKSAQYPLAYPAFLMPAFWFTDYFQAMVAMNAVVSSLVIIPAYLIGRNFFSALQSFAVAIIAATLPFHWVFPRQIMSENIYFPLLIFAIYLAVRKPTEKRIGWDILTGVVAGLLYSTRHISLVIIFALACSWLLTNWRDAPFKRAPFITAALTLTYLPWVWMQSKEGVAFFDIFGGGIASKTNPMQLTLERLSTVACLYASYFLLMAGPTLGIILISVIRIIRLRTFEKIWESRLQIAVFLITIAVFFAVTRHSWRASYNFPEINRIMGRYLIYFPFMFFLVSFAEINIYSKYQKDFKKLLLFCLISSILIIIGYSVIFYDAIVKIDLNGFLTDRGSIDGYQIWRLGPYWLLFALGGISITILIMYKRKTISFITVFATVLLMQISGIISYRGVLERHTVYSRPVAALKAMGIEDNFSIYLDESITLVSSRNFRNVRQSLAFYDMKGETAALSAMSSRDEEKINVAFIKTGTNIQDTDRIIDKFTIENQEYALVLLN